MPEQSNDYRIIVFGAGSVGEYHLSGAGGGPAQASLAMTRGRSKLTRDPLVRHVHPATRPARQYNNRNPDLGRQLI